MHIEDAKENSEEREGDFWGGSFIFGICNLYKVEGSVVILPCMGKMYFGYFFSSATLSHHHFLGFLSTFVSLVEPHDGFDCALSKLASIHCKHNECCYMFIYGYHALWSYVFLSSPPFPSGGSFSSPNTSSICMSYLLLQCNFWGESFGEHFILKEILLSLP